MQLMDQYTIEKLGLPGAILMENAGAKAADEIKQSLQSNKEKAIVILAGTGNNGGDGFVIGRRLADVHLDCCIVLLGDPIKLRGDARLHYNVYRNRELPLWHYAEIDLHRLLLQADVIIDCMLGTGTKGPVRKPLDEAIGIVNSFSGQKMIIAIDVPSGLDSDKGSVGNIAIKADKTITFVCPKKGFFLQKGPEHIGDWKAVEISVPISAARALDLKLPELVTEKLVQELIPERPASGHKGTFGHVLVAGGSQSYVGAPQFTAKAAYHSGAGLVSLALPAGIFPIVAPQLPEIMFLPAEEENGHFSEDAIADILSQADQYDVIAVGPGMSRFASGSAWISSLLDGLNGQPVVLDADALYLMRNSLEAFQEYPGDILLTPHPGEMAALTGVTVKDVEQDRIGTATHFAQKHGVYVLLKGHRSVIAEPDGYVYINPIGSDSLGKGGSGDVLTGLVASFLAQGAAPAAALITSVFLHAKGADIQAEELSSYGVTPMDILEGVKTKLKELTREI